MVTLRKTYEKSLCIIHFIYFLKKTIQRDELWFKYIYYLKISITEF